MILTKEKDSLAMTVTKLTRDLAKVKFFTDALWFCFYTSYTLVWETQQLMFLFYLLFSWRHSSGS